MLSRSTALLAALLLGACAQTNISDGGSIVTGAAPGAGEEAKVELPKCAQPLARIALVEKPIAVLDQLGLTTPLPMLNTMIAQSGCFQIVDLSAADIANGRPTGKRKGMITPDYLLSADILAQNPDSGSFNTGAISSFLPGFAGSVAGSVSVKTSEVRTALFLSDTKTGLQVASVTGHAQTSDVGASFSRFAKTSVSIGVYADTPIGKTTTAAFLDAYIKLVKEMKASPKVVAKR